MPRIDKGKSVYVRNAFLLFCFLLTSGETVKKCGINKKMWNLNLTDETTSLKTYQERKKCNSIDFKLIKE